MGKSYLAMQSYSKDSSKLYYALYMRKEKILLGYFSFTEELFIITHVSRNRKLTSSQQYQLSKWLDKYQYDLSEDSYKFLLDENGKYQLWLQEHNIFNYKNYQAMGIDALSQTFIINLMERSDGDTEGFKTPRELPQ